MEEFSLNNVRIELFRIQKSSNNVKLKNLNELKEKEKISLMKFLYDLFIDVIGRGNRFIYINDEVIYFNKEACQFKYHSPTLTKVSFDTRNIIFVHPDYLNQKDDQSKIELNRLKYVVWSIGILILKFIFNVDDQNLLMFHRFQDNLTTIYIKYNINEAFRIFLKFCLSYEENFFSDFYKFFKDLRSNQFYLCEKVRRSYSNKDINFSNFLPIRDLNLISFCESIKNESQIETKSANNYNYDKSKNSIYPNFKQCPYCKNFIEKTSEIKFITCHSVVCKGNKYFCWNCLNKLYINDKENHFSINGVYSETCINNFES